MRSPFCIRNRGGTGVLERICRERGTLVDWTILDPAPHPIDTRARFIKGYFPDDLPENIKFDIVVHSHVMEHMYSPVKFIKALSSLLCEKKQMIFSVPNLRYLLEHSITSVMNFEHTIYLTDEYIDYLLQKYGFLIKKKMSYMNHSVIYSVIKVENENAVEHSFDFQGMYLKNKKFFQNYIDFHKEKILELNQRMKTAESASIYLFGAHITTQFYQAFGLDMSRISCLLDNDPYKWDKRVCGTSLKVYSPQILEDLHHPIVIMPCSPYSDEIKKKITDEINHQVCFWDVGNV